MSTTGETRPRSPGSESRAGEPAAPRAGQAPAHGRPRAGHAGARQAQPPVRLTGRGCVALMVVTFLFSDLIGAWLHLDWLGGLGYAAGYLLAVAYARREALLMVVAVPPALFLAALVVVQLLTAGTSAGLSVAEGTFLTLAATAPWLFGATIAGLAAAMLRGLPRCVQELRVALAGQAPGDTGPARARSG